MQKSDWCSRCWNLIEKGKTMFYVLKTDLSDNSKFNYGVFDDEQRAKDFVKEQNHDDSIYEIKPVKNIHQKQGFLSRDDYLKSLAFDYDVDEDTVYELASVYGEEEDFDGLVTMLEDYVDIVDMFESLWTKNVTPHISKRQF